MNRGVLAALAAVLLVAGCGADATSGKATGPKPIPDSGLTDLLLTGNEANAIMGTSGMTPRGAVVSTMTDNRNLLPNLNCLGVWQVAQTSIYDSSRWKALRQQLLRAPNTDAWNYLVVESVVSYPTPDAARDFFAQSTERWRHCTNHHVNITLNEGKLPPFLSGNLADTANRLAMPYTRGEGTDVRTCQHVLGVAANVVIDVQACKPQQADPISSAWEVTDQIESKMAR